MPTNITCYEYFKNTSRNAFRLGSALTFTPLGGAVVNSLTREITPAILKATKADIGGLPTMDSLCFNTAPERKLSIMDVAIARIHTTLMWKLIMRGYGVCWMTDETKGDGGCERGFSAQPLRLSIIGVFIAREIVTTMISRITGSSVFLFSFYYAMSPVL